MTTFDSLGPLDQIRISPFGPMLREIVIRMLDHFEYDPEEDEFFILTEPAIPRAP